MLNMITRTATVLFSDIFGYYDLYILKVAAAILKCSSFHAGGSHIEGKHPKMWAAYFAYIDEAQYTAALSPRIWRRMANLALLPLNRFLKWCEILIAIRWAHGTVNPKATTQVVFTGDWSYSVKEAEAANSMADQGIEVLTCHVDSPKAIMETAGEARDVPYRVSHKSVQAGS
jgi:simple sugar transport system substrate-binding protein